MMVTGLVSVTGEAWTDFSRLWEVEAREEEEAWITTCLRAGGELDRLKEKTLILFYLLITGLG